MEPLPKVPKGPPKTAYDLTPEELSKAVQDDTKNFFEIMKRARVPQPQFPSTKEEVDKAWKMVKTLDNPPVLIGDYERQIEKAHKRREDRLKSSSASMNSVAQLGQQKNQSFPPLKVFSDYVLTGSGYAAAEEEGVDPEFVQM